MNWVHPEQKPNEVMLINMAENNKEAFEAIPYASKRRGEVAYNIGGTPIPGWNPIFADSYESRNYQDDLEQFPESFFGITK